VSHASRSSRNAPGFILESGWVITIDAHMRMLQPLSIDEQIVCADEQSWINGREIDTYQREQTLTLVSINHKGSLIRLFNFRLASVVKVW